MPERRPAPVLTRADLPDQITADTIRDIPISTLRRFADRRNGILDDTEQRAFNQALHEVMRDSAQRVSRQWSKADLRQVQRDKDVRTNRARGGGRTSRADHQLDRLTRRIGQQVDLAEALAPGVDWSFAQPAEKASDTTPDDSAAVHTGASDDSGDDDAGTVSDLEQRITDQVELVEVMSEIADVSKRTFDLEQQRDLQSTRTVFFGLVVSVAVLVAGWAPLVAAKDWTERWWTIGLTLGTCALAAVVYGLVRMRENRKDKEIAGAAD